MTMLHFSRFSFLRTASAMVLCASLSFGCKAGEGEACKEEDDCNEGLVCCKSSFEHRLRGTCEASCADVVPPEDAGTEDGSTDDASMEDASVEDASAEDASTEDAGEEDASVEDAGEEDASTEDAGEEDASVEDAGEEDAGEADAGEDTGVE